MGQHRVEVEHDPGRILVTLHRQRLHLLGLGRFDHPVGDGTHLAIGLPLAHDEVVGDRCLLANVHDHRVPGLLLNRGAAQQTSQL